MCPLIYESYNSWNLVLLRLSWYELSILLREDFQAKIIMKMHRHFKQHWKDDYPWVEHDQHVLQGMQITLHVLQFLLLFLHLFICNYRLPITKKCQFAF